MTNLEQLLADHTILLQKIIAEAKNEASNTATKAKSITTTKELDLFSHISNNFDNLIKDKKEKNILTPYVNPYNWPRNNNCWAKGLDLTGYCACIVPLGGVGGGTLPDAGMTFEIPKITQMPTVGEVAEDAAFTEQDQNSAFLSVSVQPPVFLSQEKEKMLKLNPSRN